MSSKKRDCTLDAILTEAHHLARLIRGTRLARDLALSFFHSAPSIGSLAQACCIIDSPRVCLLPSHALLSPGLRLAYFPTSNLDLPLYQLRKDSFPSIPFRLSQSGT